MARARSRRAATSIAWLLAVTACAPDGRSEERTRSTASPAARQIETAPLVADDSDVSISNADNAPDVARDGEHPPATFPPAASPPNVTLDLTPAWAAHGGDVRLEWRSEGAERCVAEGAWSGALPLNGDAVVQDVATDSTFVVRCSSGVHDAMAMKGVGVRHATLTWQEVDVDGAHPANDAVVGFRLFHGRDDGPLEPLDEPLSYDSRRWHVELPPGTHRWAIAPIRPDGSEGALSNVVEKWIR